MSSKNGLITKACTKNLIFPNDMATKKTKTPSTP